MFKLPSIFKRDKEAADVSDYGRRYGWFIEKDGERIGELEYLRWDADSQFWHEYRVHWRSLEDAVLGPDDWISSRLILRNRHYKDVVVDSFLTAQHVDETVLIRGAYVTAERMKQSDKPTLTGEP